MFHFVYSIGTALTLVPQKNVLLHQLVLFCLVPMHVHLFRIQKTKRYNSFELQLVLVTLYVLI
jgi:hypothetical protein